MYVAARGLGRCRGMGSLQDLGPDDPALQEPEGFTTYGATSGGTYPYQFYSTFLKPAPSITDWLNANSGKVMIGAAALFGLVLVAKAGR